MLALHSLGSSSPRPSPDGTGTAGRLVEPDALRRDSGKAPPPSGRLFRATQLGLSPKSRWLSERSWDSWCSALTAAPTEN